jgi:hypothetical protein
MTQHKWHKEIKAWADGAEIEQRHNDHTDNQWDDFDSDWGDGASKWEFRIKPQPKEPQYLYVYEDLQWDLYSYKLCRRKGEFGTYIGKIKLESDE